MTVAEMLGKLDSRELTEWMAFFEIERRRQTGEPAGETVEDRIKQGLQFAKLGPVKP